jgi:hypothetical protein
MDSYLAQGGGNNPIVNPIVFDIYTPNSLPTKSGSVSLSASITNYPKEWFELETEVGFSTIQNLNFSLIIILSFR